MVLQGLRLRWRSRPSLVDAVLKLTPAPAERQATPGLLSVAAVQMAYRKTADPTVWVEQCQALTVAAVRAGAQVIVFPAGAPRGLLTALGDAELAAAYVGQQDEPPSAEQRRTYARLYPAVHRLQHRTFSFLAYRAGVTIVAGGLPAPTRTQPALAADVYATDGRLRLHQPATVGGQRPATPELPTLPIDGSRLGAVVLQEAERTWLASALTASKVDVLATLPVVHDNAGETAVALATEGYCYVIQARMVPSLQGGAGEAHSAIYVPRALSADGSGLLAQARSVDGEEVVLASLSLTDLAASRAAAADAERDRAQR